VFAKKILRKRNEKVSHHFEKNLYFENFIKMFFFFTSMVPLWLFTLITKQKESAL
jgi:hypothetical protein